VLDVAEQPLDVLALLAPLGRTREQQRLVELLRRGVDLRDLARGEQRARLIDELVEVPLRERVEIVGLARLALGVRRDRDRLPLVAAQRARAPRREDAALLGDDLVRRAGDEIAAGVRAAEQRERCDREPEQDRQRDDQQRATAAWLDVVVVAVVVALAAALLRWRGLAGRGRGRRLGDRGVPIGVAVCRRQARVVIGWRRWIRVGRRPGDAVPLT